MPTALVAPPATGGPVRDGLPAGSIDTPLVRLPLLLTTILLAFLLVPRVQASAHLMWTFGGGGAALLGWQALLWAAARRGKRRLSIEAVAPVRQHYIQACVQLGVYGYWGWYWRPIYDQVPLILSQLAFAFAFEALFAWSRGRTWRLTSGPVPIVLSTNLFIWFVDGWFALQFAMIAAGMLGKELLKWEKDGRRTHIFNPSGFGLLVTALALIATGTTDTITMARPLANTIDHPPHIYLVLFGLGLIVQRFFAVTLMTLCAVIATVAFTQAYYAMTGVHLFVATNMPAAGFLGMHLLMTDPSTSPKTNVGKAIFGTCYGVLYSALFLVLGWAGNLELYAKLFPVPILNTAVQILDRFAAHGAVGRFNTRWQTVLSPMRMNLVHMGVWIAFFATLFGTGYLSKEHEGSSIEFWKHAVAEGKPLARQRLAMIAIGNASPDALNEMGVLSMDPEFMRLPATQERPKPEYWFGLATSNGSIHGARNAVLQYLFTARSVQGPTLGLALQVVRADAEQTPGGLSTLLLAYANETGRGMPKDTAAALKGYRACAADPVARKGIARLALSRGGDSIDLGDALAVLEKDAMAGDAESAWYVAYLHAGRRTPGADPERAKSFLQRACDLGLRAACDALQQPALPPFEPLAREQMARPAWSTAYP